MKQQCMLLLCILLLAIGATGCGLGESVKEALQNKDEEQQASSDEDLTACQELVEQFLKGYQNLDGSVGQLLSENEEGEELTFPSFQAIFAQHMTYEVGDVEEEDGVPLVSITVTTLDFAEIFSGVVEDNPEASAEKLVSEFEDRLKAEDAPTKIFECQVPVRRTQEGLRIYMNSAFSNALLGGGMQYWDEVMMQEMEAESNEN